MLKQCPFCMVDLLVIKPHTFSPMGIVAVKVTWIDNALRASCCFLARAERLIIELTIRPQ